MVSSGERQRGSGGRRRRRYKRVARDGTDRDSQKTALSVGKAGAVRILCVRQFRDNSVGRGEVAVVGEVRRRYYCGVVLCCDGGWGLSTRAGSYDRGKLKVGQGLAERGKGAARA